MELLQVFPGGLELGRKRWLGNKGRIPTFPYPGKRTQWMQREEKAPAEPTTRELLLKNVKQFPKAARYTEPPEVLPQFPNKQGNLFQTPTGTSPSQLPPCVICLLLHIPDLLLPDLLAAQLCACLSLKSTFLCQQSLGKALAAQWVGSLE